MPEGPLPKTRSRGPAAGRLWSGQAAPEAPPPGPPPPQPTLERSLFDVGPRTEPPPPEEPPRRRGSVWGRALLGGALSGLLVAAAALALGATILDDDEEPSGAQPPAIVASTGGSNATSVGAIYAAASPAVASIQSTGGAGTGFLTDSDGTIVTNAHVVGSSAEVRVRFGDEGRLLEGEVVGRDTSTDLAVVKVEAGAVEDIDPLQFADSDEVQVGDLAVAIGNPLGLPQTATAGIVSGLEREIQAPNGFQIDEVIQTDAPINPGNSGGPLLDEQGRVIGVNSQIATAGAGGGNIGIGFAVPSNTAREVVPQLKRGATIRRAWLGVSTSPATGGGAEVQVVTPGSPADQAGVRVGDVITGIDGQPMRGPDDVSDAVSDREPGDRISVEVRRGVGGANEDVPVTLGTRPR